MAYYEVKPEYAGKSLSQLQREGVDVGRPDLLAGFLGFNENDPLQAGQSYADTLFPENYRKGSSEWYAFQRLFGPGMSPEERAIQPALRSYEAGIPETQARFAGERTRLEAEKEPLTARYARLLKDITSRTELASSREFGRRGIPLSSGLFESTLAERIEPQTERIGLAREGEMRNLNDLIAQLTGQETESVRGIRNAIAMLQAGAGKDTIENAFRMLQFQEQQRQFNQQQSLQNAQAAYYNAMAQGKISSSPYQGDWEVVG